MLEPLDCYRRDSTLFQFTTKRLRDFIDPNHLLVAIDEKFVTGKLFSKSGPRWAADSLRRLSRRPGFNPVFFVHGDLILCNSVNEAKGFTDKAWQISSGSIPFRTPV